MLSTSLRWTSEDEESRGVRRRGFSVTCEDRSVPGLLWTPVREPVPSTWSAAANGSGPPEVWSSSQAPLPLVLVGHGGSHDKRQDYVMSVGRRLARHHGVAAAAIDGPVHGDRQPDGGHDAAVTFLRFAQAWSSDPDMTDTMVSDWQATLDALQALPELGSGPVGYWGLSMGTILGLPFVAAEPRIQAAVLGLMGMTGPTVDRIATDAPKVVCPALFLVQWDDTLFERPCAFELFDALGSSDKRLLAHPGGHGDVPDDGFVASIDFLAAHLT